MNSSITSCPNCDQLLLSDTVQCPGCQHLLHPERAEQVTTTAHTGKPEVAVITEEPCRECGAMTRKGLVRCMACGAFIKSEIEQSFFALQKQQPTVPTMSAVEESAGVSDTASSTVTSEEQQPESYELSPDGTSSSNDDADNDDAEFELGAGFELDAEYELDDEFALADDDDWDDEVQNTIDDDAEVEPEAVDAEETEAEEETYGLNHDTGDNANAYADVASPDDIQRKKEEALEQDNVLFEIAMQETAEQFAKERRDTRLRKRMQSKYLGQADDGSIRLKPPCRCGVIRVPVSEAGQTLNCPHCQAAYIAPGKAASEKEELTEQEKAEIVAERLRTHALQDQPKEQVIQRQSQGAIHAWIEGAYKHDFNPKKTKPKKDILARSYTVLDIGFSDAGLLLLSLTPKAGAHLPTDSKIQALREQAREAITQGNSLEGIAGIEEFFLPVGELAQWKVVSPLPPSDEKSASSTKEQSELETLLEARVSIFGSGRIGILIPSLEKENQTSCLSLLLSQFRGFQRALSLEYGFSSFSLESSVCIPFENNLLDHECVIKKTTFVSLALPEFYEADEMYPTQFAGYICQSCQATISEAGREESSLGGKDGKTIAKAKCPVCDQKIGNTQLISIALANSSK